MPINIPTNFIFLTKAKKKSNKVNNEIDKIVQNVRFIRLFTPDHFETHHYHLATQI